jgi:hypothetical protein
MPNMCDLHHHRSLQREQVLIQISKVRWPVFIIRNYIILTDDSKWVENKLPISKWA